LFLDGNGLEDSAVEEEKRLGFEANSHLLRIFEPCRGWNNNAASNFEKIANALKRGECSNRGQVAGTTCDAYENKRLRGSESPKRIKSESPPFTRVNSSFMAEPPNLIKYFLPDVGFSVHTYK
jgi:hypothetical protein